MSSNILGGHCCIYELKQTSILVLINLNKDQLPPHDFSHLSALGPLLNHRRARSFPIPFMFTLDSCLVLNSIFI